MGFADFFSRASTPPKPLAPPGNIFRQEQLRHAELRRPTLTRSQSDSAIDRYELLFYTTERGWWTECFATVSTLTHLLGRIPLEEPEWYRIVHRGSGQAVRAQTRHECLQWLKRQKRVGVIGP